MSGHFDAQVAVAAVQCALNKSGGICFACAVKVAREGVSAGRQQAFAEAVACATRAAEMWDSNVKETMDAVTRLTRRERRHEAMLIASDIQSAAKEAPRSGKRGEAGR